MAKFCDKLAKKRKENNLSQELLADRLRMSRQAVSKWESGSSYPDMEKMMEICKVLDCSLDELLDDGTLGTQKREPKLNINDFSHDLLKYITRTYNMFCSMNFKDKLKCLFEMTFVVLFLILGFSVMGTVLRNITNPLINLFPVNLGVVVSKIFYFLYGIITLILIIIVTLHLFKIRYLDYFVTIEDSNTLEKTIEKPVDTNNGKIGDKNSILERPKEKIIIRDPKHSSNTFLNGIVNLFVIFLKICAALISIPFIISFIFAIFCATYGIATIGFTVIIWGLIIGVLGFLLINYIVFEEIYNFIFNRNHHFKRIFIMFICGLGLLGIGAGIFVSSASLYKIEKFVANDYDNVVEEVKMNNDLVMKFLSDENTEIVIDNSLKNIKLELACPTFNECNFFDYFDNKYKIYEINDSPDYLEVYRLILNGLKNKIVYDYENINNNKIKVYISNDNYNIIVKNNNEFNKRNELSYSKRS